MGFVRGCFGPALRFGQGGSIMMILFWGALIIGGIYLVKNLNESNNDSNVYQNNSRRETNESNREESPEEIARRRYARGEIDREEYNQIKEDLRN